MVLYALIALIGVGYTGIAKKTPSLGLDLAGGVSVVLDPYRDGKLVTDPPKSSIEQAIEIIRSRVDTLGVAEPEISSQGNSILVQIPGIDDQKRALELMGRTAQLRFRPVLSSEQVIPPNAKRVKELRAKLKMPDGVTAAEIYKIETGVDLNAPATTAPPASTAPTTPTTISLAPTVPPATEAPATTAKPETPTATSATTAPATATSQGAAGVRGAGRFGAHIAAQNGGGSTTAAPTTAAPATAKPSGASGSSGTSGASGTAGVTTTTAYKPKNKWKIDPTSKTFSELLQLEQANTVDSRVTPPEKDKADKPVTLLSSTGDELFQLGPSELTGDALSGADAGLGGQSQSEWAVFPAFKKGPQGIDLFNAASKRCYDGVATCPVSQGGVTGRLAIVLDGKVLTAPSINADDKQKGLAFQPYKAGKSGLQISGAFTEQSAKDVATALRFGALPLELRASSAQNVSATLGEGALRAAIIAGIIGLIMVAGYMLFYYRLLGVVTVFGILLSAGILWAVISLIGASLTLAGLVGIIVSIGVSLDSNVVFFENLKEDVHNGRTLRSAVSGSFASAFSTIVKADVSSLIGAGVLWVLTAGPVRGFATYLLLTTAIDLVSSYFWMRPATLVLAQSSLGAKPTRFGIPDLLPEKDTSSGNGDADAVENAADADDEVAADDEVMS